MNDIVDYSKKLKEETTRQKNIFIVIGSLIAFFTFAIGFYVSYLINVGNKDLSAKNKFDTIYSILSEEWYYGKNDENLEKNLIDRAIYGMLDTQTDPFTRYLTSLGSLASSFEGLGITVSEYKEYFIITEVASKINMGEDGFKVGDIVKSIDGNSLANKKSEYIKELIENKETVSVVVQRDGVEKTITGYITIYTPVTVFSDLSVNDEFAYIRISEFASDTASLFDEHLENAKNRNYDKLILDLRDNPGGYITSVVDCADLLMGKNKVVLTTKEKDDHSYSYKTSDEDKYDFSKIVVLINNNSASGAEALAAALNENMNDKVDLVGVKTYGKGSAQKMITFTDGTYFNYTYALWFTPNDNSIHKVGVSPENAYTGQGIHLLPFVSEGIELTNYGENVYNLQVIMKELGFYEGALTSYYDTNLETAVKAFQASQNIEQTGKLDDLTTRYLLAKYQDDKVADYKNEIDVVLARYNAN